MDNEQVEAGTAEEERKQKRINKLGSIGRLELDFAKRNPIPLCVVVCNVRVCYTATLLQVS